VAKDGLLSYFILFYFILFYYSNQWPKMGSQGAFPSPGLNFLIRIGCLFKAMERFSLIESIIRA